MSKIQSKQKRKLSYFILTTRSLKLLNLSKELGNFLKLVKRWDTFYRYQQDIEQGAVEALLNQTHRVPNIKNQVDEKAEQAVVKFVLDFPTYGQVYVSNELSKQGIFVSAGEVHSIWLRNNLANFKCT